MEKLPQEEQFSLFSLGAGVNVLSGSVLLATQEGSFD